MEARAAPEDDDRDWRLSGELRDAGGHGVLHAFVERMRDESVLEEARGAVGEEVVITHDGSRLFAYASGRARIERARGAIEAVLAEPDFSTTADLYSVVSNVYALRVVPVRLREVLMLVGAVALPYVPIILFTVPPQVIWEHLRNVLL